MVSDPRTVRIARKARDLATAALAALRQAEGFLDIAASADVGIDPLLPEDGGVIDDGNPGVPIDCEQVRRILRMAEVLKGLGDDNRDPETGQPTPYSGRGLLVALSPNA